MTHHVLEMPVSEAQVRALRVGDTVTLEKTLFGIRDATLIAMFDRGRATRFNLKGHAVVHTAPNVRKVDPRPEQLLRLRAALHRHHHLDAHGTLHAGRLMQRDGVRHHHRQRRHGAGDARCVHANSAAPISPWSAAPPRWRPPGSRRSRTSISTSCNPECLVEIPHQGLRPAAGDHGLPRRLAARAGQCRSGGAARGGAGQHRQHVNVQTLETDILILGAGGAGCSPRCTPRKHESRSSKSPSR